MRGRKELLCLHIFISSSPPPCLDVFLPPPVCLRYGRAAEVHGSAVVPLAPLLLPIRHPTTIPYPASLKFRRTLCVLLFLFFILYCLLVPPPPLTHGCCVFIVISQRHKAIIGRRTQPTLPVVDSRLHELPPPEEGGTIATRPLLLKKLSIASDVAGPMLRAWDFLYVTSQVSNTYSFILRGRLLRRKC